MTYKGNHLLAVCVMAMLLVASAFAQRTTGSIQGRVTDPQGAVVSKAKVTITNTATNLRLELTTNEEGVYEAANLPPAEYEVSAEAPGFSASKIGVPVRV